MNYRNLPLQMRVDIADAALAHAQAMAELFAANMQHDYLSDEVKVANAVSSRTGKALYDLQAAAAKLMAGE